MQKEDGNINLLKKFILAVDSFFNDDTTYYAASLSFFTIFSILPIIALAIAIISNFPEFHAYMNTFTIYLFNFINPTHSKDIIEALENYISNSNKLGFLIIYEFLKLSKYNFFKFKFFKILSFNLIFK